MRSSTVWALAWAAAVAVLLGLFLLPQLREPQVTEGDGVAVPDPDEVYDPVEAGEELPQGWRQLLPRDGIRPIYDPRFVAADEAGWRDDTLVLGVALGGEARAYPINVLTQREIVNDVIGDIPVLASW
jgi:hypothetical protein